MVTTWAQMHVRTYVRMYMYVCMHAPSSTHLRTYQADHKINAHVTTTTYVTLPCTTL